MTNQPAAPMTVAVQHWDRTSALIDRRVTLPNVSFIAVPNRVGWEGLFAGIFDAAELPVARFVFCHEQGDPLVAVPVFPDRLFLQRYIYVLADAPFQGLADLRGRRIGLPGYYFTASFWHRQFLREAGVAPEDVEWISTAPELDKRMAVPQDIRYSVRPATERGLSLLFEGEAECLMHEYTLVPSAGAPRIRRLLPDTLKVHAGWYVRTAVFPALHLMAVRAEALQRRPDFGIELCRAFDEARDETYRWLSSERTTALPFAREAIDRSLELFGDDPWPYGLEKNARELEQFLDLAHADGLVRRREKLAELFDPRAAAYDFRSRLKA